MLILSRRPSETLRFPQLGIAVTVVSVKGSRVQVGIEAPPEIRVIRHELEDRLTEATDRLEIKPNVNLAATEKKTIDQSTHSFRNQLNKATLGLHLAQKQLAAGLFESADKTLTIALTKLAELESTAKPVTTAANALGSNALGSNAMAPAQPSIETKRSSSKGADSKGIHVLLVEDDLNEQALLKSLLEMEGYRVHTACNGHEALTCLNRIAPKFILLDMMMPECDGRETLNRIREIPAFEHLPIFAVSGSSPASVGLSIGSDGVEDWFPKPLNASRLLQHMRDKVACLSS